MSEMICPHCKQEVDSSMPFCLNCGKDLAPEGDQITNKFKDSITSQRQGELQYFMRGILVLVIFMFIAALIFAYSVSSEPVLDIKPAYPIVSPEDALIDGYTPGEKVNTGVFDSIGFPMSDLKYPEGSMISDVIEQAEREKAAENSDDGEDE